MKPRIWLVVAAASAGALWGGCGGGHDHPTDSGSDAAPFAGCASETRADTYVANLEKSGANGIKVILVESTPAPPVRFENDWHIRVLDSTSMPMQDAEVTVEPFMPDHGHGTTKPTTVMALTEPGEFMLSPVHLFMPGLWEVRIDVASSAGMQDRVIFNICIDG